MRHDDAMAMGSRRYSDALKVLRRFGPTEFTQTGGGCAALELTLERGYLLITAADDSLPWSREHLRGWGVGYYPTQDVCDGPEAFVESDNTSINILPDLVERCLREIAATR